MAKFEKEFPVLFAKQAPPRLETSTLSSSLKSPDVEDMLINGMVEEDGEDDDNNEPCELVDSDDEDEPETARLARSEEIRLEEEREAEFDEFMTQRADDMNGASINRVKVVDSVSVPTDKLNDLDARLAAMALDINERCKALLERDGGVPTTATLNLFEELVNDSNALLVAMGTEIEVEVAADSGDVDHVAGPDDIPGCIPVAKTRVRNFIGPTGKPIEHHGEALLHLVNETGRIIGSVFQIANVVRPLHSVSKICDEKHEMPLTATESTVVPAGALSKFLASLKGTITYQRKGGLYVTKVKVKSPGTSSTSSFTRPGVSR
jgi:hypothetical protein